MATASLAPAFFFTALDDDGIIVPGCQLFFTLSGSSTPAIVWRDGDMTSAWTNPVVCDAAGRATIYLDPQTGNLKMRMADAQGVFFGPTTDPVTPTNASAGPGGSVGDDLFVFGSNPSAQVTALVYTPGATYNTLHPGSSVWVVDPAVLSGVYVLEIMGVMEAAGTLSVSLVNLDGGAPDVPIATATLTSLTGAVAQSGPITFPAGGTSIHFGLKTIVSANDGFLIGARILRTA